MPYDNLEFPQIPDNEKSLCIAQTWAAIYSLHSRVTFPILHASLTHPGGHQAALLMLLLLLLL